MVAEYHVFHGMEARKLIEPPFPWEFRSALHEEVADKTELPLQLFSISKQSMDHDTDQNLAVGELDSIVAACW